MKILIVYAHPMPKSFNGAMKDLASQVLQEAGHSVQIYIPSTSMRSEA